MFPRLEEVETEDGETEEDQEATRPFTLQELQESLKQLKTRKAPGEDLITNEILNICVVAKPDCFLKVFNRCLDEGDFPARWKRGLLMLIPKPIKEGESQAYRPLCLLSAVGKLLERLINNRLVEHLRNKQAISEWQYGYTKERSTVDAVMEIVKRSQKLKETSLTHRKMMIIVMLDVRNAFNTVPWSQLKKAIRKKEVDYKTRKLLTSYLSDRRLIIPGGEEKRITCGVAQGSVLGGTLWNIFYDDVLRVPLEEGVGILAYADDVALVVEGRTAEEIKDKAEYCVEQIIEKLKKMGLRLAEQKTEVVILEGRRKLQEISIKVGTAEIKSCQSAKYLGIHLDKDMRMTTHVKLATQKALQKQVALAKIMPRVGGPSSGRRMLLAAVVQSVLLYGAPTWEVTLKHKKYVNLIRTVERKMSVGVTSAYRTVATDAIGVIARCPPYDLLVWERARNWQTRGDRKKEFRKEVMTKWQNRWAHYNGWAKTFIVDVEEWMKMSLQTDYYITQALTGHGIFRSYLKKIKKQETEECWYGCGEADTPQHCLFECARFQEDRRKLEEETGRRFQETADARPIMGDKATAEKLLSYLRSVMMEKDREEKRRENRTPQ